MRTNAIHGALFGVAIGDALGVLAEFKSRTTLLMQPVQDFEGYKSHNQPPGTFSDDSSLTFCLAESLCAGFDLNDVADRFIRWKEDAYWTAGGLVFDIGMTTNNAISRLRSVTRPALAGDFEENCNGNGSLMRILPLLFYIRDFDIDKRFELTKEVSSITHAHIRSVIACFYYLEYALELLKGKDKQSAYNATAKLVVDYLINKRIEKREIDLFDSLLIEDITKQSVDNISSSGYVLSTLTAAMYCFMTTDSYQEAVLMAVNLGSDADTTAAVTGGLAGLYYGYETIPEKWRHEIRKKEEINDLCDRFTKAMDL
jgi:ADP-ribosyl-[dinitrogen reductase] hydrolase